MREPVTQTSAYRFQEQRRRTRAKSHPCFVAQENVVEIRRSGTYMDVVNKCR